MASFHDISVSTQTIIARSNLTHIDIDGLASKLQVNSVLVGVKKNFLNCMSINVMLDKKINIKIFKNGSFQMTGCKHLEHGKRCVETIVSEFKKFPECYILDGDIFVIYIISAMRNVNFALGFKIDRVALGRYIHENTDFSVPPMTRGYMGVKIGIPLKDVNKLKIYKLEFEEFGIVQSVTNYLDFYTHIFPDPKRLKQKRTISISVFQNGKVIMSGIDLDYQIGYYNWFIDLIKRIKPEISIQQKPLKSFRHRRG